MRKRRRTSDKLKPGMTTVSKKQVDNNQSRIIQRLVKLTKGIAPERKFFDTTLSFLNVSDTVGAVSHISAVAQGDLVSNRTGNKIRVKSIYVQVRVSTVSIDGLVEGFARFYIVRDLQQVGDTSPTASDILNAVNTPQSVLTSVATQGRFKIIRTFPLMDFTMIRSSNAIQSAVQYYYKSRFDIPITYNGVNGADIQKNGLYVVVVTSDTTDVSDYDGIARVSYVDD